MSTRFGVYEVKVIVWALAQQPHSKTISNISSKASDPIVTTAHLEPPWVEGTKICSNRPIYMTNMAMKPIYGTNL